VMPTSPPTVEYELTELGRELLPAIRSIVEVGTRLLLRDSIRRLGRSHGSPTENAPPRASCPI
jgi:DNA-binding HxlR family transcriptional regulator